MIVGLLGRHGENPENRKNIFRGRIDEPLDETGITQAQELADFIVSRYMVERIVSSPLIRAMQTAKPVAEAFGLPIIQEGALMSMDTGFLTGEDKDEFAEVYEFFLDNPDKQIPRGESLEGAHDRIGDFMEQDLKTDTFTLYMAHSSTGVVLSNLLEGSRKLKPGVDHIVEPGGLSEINWDGESYQIVPVFQVSEEKETPINGR